MKRSYIATFLSLFLSLALSAAQEAEVRFAFLADLHYSKGSVSVSDLRRCISDINSQSGLDFVLVGGDLTDFGTDEEISGVKQMLDSLEYDYYVVPGNHDAKWSESGCNTFRKVFGYETFGFSRKGWRFIGCSCGPDMRMAPGLVPQESMEWLRKTEPGERTVFVNHYPQDTSVLNYFDVTRELKRIGTRFAIGGHWHSNVALEYDGIPAVLCRSTLSAGLNPGYSIVSISGDTVTVSERRLYGSTPVLLEPWYRRRLVEVPDTSDRDSHGLPSDYPWMKYDVNGNSPVKAVWQYRDNSNIVAGFARAKGKAWYTTASGQVRCISLKDGSRIWSAGFPGKIFSTPALAGNVLVFGCSDGFIYGLDARKGTVKWKVRAGKSVLGSPAVHDGKVFIGASDGVFRALNARNGSVVWEFGDVEGFVECRPFVDGSQVVFGTWANRLYSLSTSDGTLQWVWKCAKPSRMYSPAAVWPVKSDGKIFIAVPDRKMYVLDAASGREVKVFASCARESVGISADGSAVYCKAMNHALTSVDASTLEIGWRVETGAGYDISPTSVAVLGSEVVMPTDKGNLVGFDAASGERTWAFKVAEALVNPIEAWVGKDGRRMMLVSTMDGAVALLER